MIRFHLHAVQYVESHLIRIYCSIWQSLDVSGLKIYMHWSLSSPHAVLGRI